MTCKDGPGMRVVLGVIDIAPSEVAANQCAPGKVLETQAGGYRLEVVLPILADQRIKVTVSTRDLELGGRGSCESASRAAQRYVERAQSAVLRG